jgi:hypothetical protein
VLLQEIANALLLVLLNIESDQTHIRKLREAALAALRNTTFGHG